MLRIAVSGVTGRMGQTLVQLITQADDLVLAGGIARAARQGDAAGRYGCERIAAVADAGEVIAGADVLIDFSSPAGLEQLLEQHAAALAGRALVVGTTGLGDATEAQLTALDGQTAVLVAANFSIGVHVLARLLAEAASLLDAGEYDIEIVETHHRAKRDAPSGTALLLGRAAAAARGVALDAVRRDGRSGAAAERAAGEIALHAVRGGGVIGEHRVLLLGERERIELSHAALDRSIFAAGALRAARWLATRQPGRYSMAELVG